MELIYKVHLKFIIVIMNFLSILLSMTASAASITIFLLQNSLYIAVKLDYDIDIKYFYLKNP